MRIFWLGAVFALGMSGCKTNGTGLSSSQSLANQGGMGQLDCSIDVPNGESTEARVDRFVFSDPSSTGSSVVWTPFGVSGQSNMPETYKVTSVVPQRCIDCYEVIAEVKGGAPLFTHSAFKFMIETPGKSSTSNLTVQYLKTPGGPPDFVTFSHKAGVCQKVAEASSNPASTSSQGACLFTCQGSAEPICTEGLASECTNANVAKLFEDKNLPFPRCLGKLKFTAAGTCP